MTMPLVTDANGNKFGKSEGNAVWIDKNKTSSYELYQFLLNSEDAVVIDYLKTVSYTHLDVYKRQGLFFLQNKPVGRFVAMGQPYIHKRNFSLEPFYPVSYTHLDVYKRQLLEQAAKEATTITTARQRASIFAIFFIRISSNM